MCRFSDVEACNLNPPLAWALISTMSTSLRSKLKERLALIGGAEKSHLVLMKNRTHMLKSNSLKLKDVTWEAQVKDGLFIFIFFFKKDAFPFYLGKESFHQKTNKQKNTEFWIYQQSWTPWVQPVVLCVDVYVLSVSSLYCVSTQVCHTLFNLHSLMLY